jgi:hypothetical protein
MITKKIKLTELRQLVKQIIKEETNLIKEDNKKKKYLKEVWSDDDSKPEKYEDVIIYKINEIKQDDNYKYFINNLYYDAFPNIFKKRDIFLNNLLKILKDFMKKNKVNKIPFADEGTGYVSDDYDDENVLLDYMNIIELSPNNNNIPDEINIGDENYETFIINSKSDPKLLDDFHVMNNRIRNLGKNTDDTVFGLYDKMYQKHFLVISNNSENIQSYVANKYAYRFNGYITLVSEENIDNKLYSYFRLTPKRDYDY